MYYNYITGGFGSSFYGVATSPTPKGPFTVVNPNVLLLHSDNGDENIFVDDDGSAYIIYTSLSVGHSISIELLSPDYLNSTLKSSGVFGESFVEVRAMCSWGAMQHRCSLAALCLDRCPFSNPFSHRSAGSRNVQARGILLRHVWLLLLLLRERLSCERLHGHFSSWTLLEAECPRSPL